MRTEHEICQAEVQFARKSVRKPLKKRVVASMVSMSQFCIVVALTLLLGVYMTSMLRAEPHLKLYIDGELAGVVKDTSVVQTAVDRIFVGRVESMSTYVSPKITYAFCMGDSAEQVLDSDDCFALLSGYLQHNYSVAYALRYNGAVIANLASAEEADEIMERYELLIKQAILANDDTINTIDFKIDYSVEEVTCEKRLIQDAGAVYNMLYASFEEKFGASDSEEPPSVSIPEETPAIGEGESSGLRVNAFITESNLMYDLYHSVDVLRNPKVNEILSDEIQSMLSKIELSYQTYHTETNTELIPYKTEYIESPEHYVGFTLVQIQGENGLRENFYEVCCLAGEEISRNEISTKVLIEPVNSVVIVGTKPYPQPIPTGTYVWPLAKERYIISKFGWRTDPFTGVSTYHNGIDIPAIINTPIYAIDGGEVIFAGYQGTYGLMVMIDHGNGIVSLYAHQNELIVKKGDRVYQGQQIGYVGETGRATGPHLHLEVRVNGVRKNPLKYLPKR